MDLGPDIISLVSATLRISTPLVFAAMAGLFAERSGVIDFGLEGKMLAAAFVAASGAHVFGSEWYGLALAIVCCVALSMLHGFASVTHKGDQVVSCVAINIVVPCEFISFNSFIILSDFSGSRFPVGSSAKIISG